MSERFYINCPLQPGPIELTGPEARHLAVVCRLRPGDLVCLFNGDGREYPARIVAVQRRAVSIEIVGVEAPERELPGSLTIAAPLPKGDRAQFLVEKLTELGVTTFMPLETERSVIHPSESRLEKLERYVIEASKQCGRNVLMRIEPPASWKTYIRRGNLPPFRVLAHPGGSALEEFDADWAAAAALTLAVGPEGGFTDDEVADAVSAGWRTLSLGPRVLRVETAALVLAAVGARWEALRRN